MAPPLHLPHIDSLRAHGTTFSRGGVVPAPVCAPSRACMASLREYDHAGTPTLTANDFPVKRIPTYFSVLQQAGYHTMTTGKDDLTKASQLGYYYGYDTHNASDTYHAHALGFSDSIRASGKEDVTATWPLPHEPYGYYLNGKGVRLANGTEISAFDAYTGCMDVAGKGSVLNCERSTFPQRLYQDQWVADAAATLLERAPANKPWMLWVNFPGPHDPFAVTSGMADEVQGRAWPPATDSDGLFPLCEPRHNARPGGGEPSHNRTRCNYASMMENLDGLFGRVLDAARRRGNTLDTDTVVCFFSDHGEMINDHNDVGKEAPWQGALNVPLVCAGPGIRRNATIHVPVATVDIGATMVDIAGASEWRDPNMTAQSFRGLLEGADPSTRNRTVVQSGLQSFVFNGSYPTSADATITLSSTSLQPASTARAADSPRPTAVAGATTSSGGASAASRDRLIAAPNELGVEVAYSFRLAVAEMDGPPRSTYKFVCCQGRCPGSPSTVAAIDADGYTRLLYDTVADPFDMVELKHTLPHVAEALRKELPVVHGFNCSRV